MNVEQLLGMLREANLDDEAIKNLLSEAIASLEGAAEESPVAEDEEKEAAGKLLGVEL